MGAIRRAGDEDNKRREAHGGPANRVHDGTSEVGLSSNMTRKADEASALFRQDCQCKRDREGIARPRCLVIMRKRRAPEKGATALATQ